MAQDDQLVFAFVHDGGFDAGASLSARLRLGRLKLLEELSAENAAVDLAWQRVERAVSAFAQVPATLGR